MRGKLCVRCVLLSQGQGEDSAQGNGHEWTETLVSLGLYKVELPDDEQPILAGGEQNSPIHL